MRRSVERFRARAGLGMALVAAFSAAACGSASEPPVKLPGRALAIAVAPDNYGTLWETTATGAYRSVDGGDSWRRVPGAPGGASIAFLNKHTFLAAGPGAFVGSHGGVTRLLAVHDPPSPLISVTDSFYGANRLYGLDAQGRVWLSVTAGASWSQVRARGLPSGGLVISARRAKTILPDSLFVAAGARGLWVSHNFGESFHRVPGIGEATGVATTTHDATRLLVSTPTGLELSTDDGASFRQVLELPGLTAIALDSRNWKNAFAATPDGLLLRSDDGGASWDQ
jgi:photosystem II stability/assembly factor-like uncharacterized protein